MIFFESSGETLKHLCTRGSLYTCVVEVSSSFIQFRIETVLVNEIMFDV